ncbi:MAG TPA: surface-adhesin E family protein [Gallionella sp.]|nr:surface-adhesin E family protein [Gallionella sp.]
MRKAFWILVLAVVCSNAAAEWVRLSTVLNGNITYYADPDTISRNGELAQMWVLQDYVAAQSSHQYLSARSQSEYDCKNKNVRPISIAFHSGNMGKGEVIDTVTARDDAWIPVPPNTMFDTLWKLACSKQIGEIF